MIDMDPVVIPKASKSDLVNDYKHGYLTFSDRPTFSASSSESSSAHGLVSQYLESADVQSLAQAHRYREYDEGDVELFATAKAWWDTSYFNSAQFNATPVEMPAWFALACYRKSEVLVAGMKEPIS